MNEHAGPDHEAAAPIPADRSGPQPWGFWSTLLWALFAFAVSAAIVGGTVLWLYWNAFDRLPDSQEDASFAVQFIAVNLLQIVVLAWAARLAGWPVGRYFGLIRPNRGDVLYGVASFGLLLLALEILTHVLGRDSVTTFQADSYRAASAAGLLPLLWLAFVVAAPVGEEIIFRGFVFRGWAASPLGVPGTILLTSLVFSAAHTQYDWFGSLQTFCIGILFGCLRWRSGSTTLTILLHMVINFTSTLWTAIKVASPA
jgi:membrane protease YdiL (CAAX protease family)